MDISVKRQFKNLGTLIHINCNCQLWKLSRGVLLKQMLTIDLALSMAMNKGVFKIIYGS